MSGKKEPKTQKVTNSEQPKEKPKTKSCTTCIFYKNLLGVNSRCPFVKFEMNQMTHLQVFSKERWDVCLDSCTRHK